MAGSYDINGVSLVKQTTPDVISKRINSTWSNLFGIFTRNAKQKAEQRRTRKGEPYSSICVPMLHKKNQLTTGSGLVTSTPSLAVCITKLAVATDFRASQSTLSCAKHWRTPSEQRNPAQSALQQVLIAHGSIESQRAGPRCLEDWIWGASRRSPLHQ